VGAPTSPLRVVVAGGGFAAAELLLAARALAGDRVDLALVAPHPRLAFRPAAPGEAFGGGPVEEFDLRDLAADVGARYVEGAVEAVAPRAHRLRLASDRALDYDALVLAIGTRPRAAIPGATTYRDQRDNPLVSAFVDDLVDGHVSRVVLAAPAGASWPLPLYELALLAGGVVEDRGLNALVTLVTPEEAPLEVFGPEVAAAVRDVLERAGVHLETGVSPGSVVREGLTLAFGGLIRADRVIAVPRLVGRRLTGVPAGWDGFVATDERGAVPGLADVYAAGDMTAFPVKQGGLAAQQAGVIAAEIARRAGAAAPDEPVRHLLRTRLLGARPPLMLAAELDGSGRALSGQTFPAPVEEPDTATEKLLARHLAPWMAAHPSRTAAA
jgi:sulfide:quinone oxidoreductase